MHLIKRISQVIKYLNKKGSSHFTIMFIPHSQRKVLSIQISNYTVLSIFLLFSFALLSLYHYSSTRKELLHDLKEIKKKDKIYWNIHKSISENIEQEQIQTANLKNEISSIYQIITDRDYLEWNDISLDDLQNDLKIKEKNELKLAVFKNVYKIKKVKSSLEEVEVRFKEIQKLLTSRSNIMEHLPTRWPVFGDKGYKTSGFGKRFSPFEGRNQFHMGVDIASFPGTPVVAAADGVVTFVGSKDGYGNTLVIRHKYGYKSLYGHNAKILVRLLQKVKKGEKISLLGRTGRTTGYHVHFEIRIDNVPVDPWPFLTVEI